MPPRMSAVARVPERDSAGAAVVAVKAANRLAAAEIEDRRRGLDRARLAVGHDRGHDGEELDHVAAPAVAALVDLDADDALRLEALGLGLHALHRQLAG